MQHHLPFYFHLKGSCLILILTISGVLSSCGERKVTITQNYLINPNWDDDESHSVNIIRMKIKEGCDSMTPDVVTHHRLRRCLVRDSTFMWTNGMLPNGVDYDQRKLYFTQKNERKWLDMRMWDPILTSQAEPPREVLGGFEVGSWYRIAGLSTRIYKRHVYYVYLEADSSFHVFKTAFFTNI